MDRLKYLMDRYNTNDIEILNCRVPFNYEDSKYDSLSDEEYIAMIDKIEELEDEDIYRLLKDRGFVE